MGRHRRSKEVGKLLDRTLELISGFDLLFSGQNLVDDGGNSVAHGDGNQHSVVDPHESVSHQNHP